jgi:hypothetical protein
MKTTRASLLIRIKDPNATDAWSETSEYAVNDLPYSA